MVRKLSMWPACWCVLLYNQLCFCKININHELIQFNSVHGLLKYLETCFSLYSQVFGVASVWLRPPRRVWDGFWALSAVHPGSWQYQRCNSFPKVLPFVSFVTRIVYYRMLSSKVCVFTFGVWLSVLHVESANSNFIFQTMFFRVTNMNSSTEKQWVILSGVIWRLSRSDFG